MALIEVDVDGFGALESGARVRDELRPIGGLLGGILGFGDTSGAPLTFGTGITLTGAALDFSISNTGLTRTVAVEYPLTLVFRGQIDATGVNALSAIATAADKMVRAYAFDGRIDAQHTGGTASATASTPNIFSYGRTFTFVAVFRAANDVSVYGAGNLGRGAGSSSTNVGALSTLTRLSYGLYDGSTKLYQQDGRTEIAQWLNYAATPAEAWAWVDSPQDIFEPLAIPIYVSAAAPALPALTLARAKSGSITSSGWISQVTAS